MPHDPGLEMIGQSLARRMKQASKSEEYIKAAGEKWKNMGRKERISLLSWYGRMHPRAAKKEASREFGNFSQQEKGAIAALVCLQNACDWA